MECRSSLHVVALFILSIILGIGVGILNFLGILQLFSGAIPYIGAIALFVILGILILIGLIVCNRNSCEHRSNEQLLCECAAGFIRPIVISALVVIVASILFIGIVGIPIVSGFVLGFLATFLFFALFLLAEIIFCLIDGACCSSSDDDPYDKR